jgi:drug/metabolite transporter (DMT)-like permease
MVIGLGAALAAAGLFGVGAVVQAVAVRRHGLLSPMVAFVVALYVVGWLLHVVAIALTPLYVAQVGTAVSLAITAIVAAWAVGEPLSGRHWVAIAAQVGGLAILALAAGDVGHHDVDGIHAIVLYVGLVVLLIGGVAAVRRTDPRSGLLLAVLAGLAYAGSPIASRPLADPKVDFATAATLLVIGLYGLLGFWLYSMAMNRITVTAATAPVILLQTLVPAAVGVLVFSDGVREGWWPAAVIGLLVSTAGALVLSGADGRLEHLEELGRDPMVGWSHDER